MFFLFLRHMKPFLPEDGGMGPGGLMFLSEEAALQTDSGVSALPSGSNKDFNTRAEPPLEKDLHILSLFVLSLVNYRERHHVH